MKIITGMHRSASSLVARLLHSAGADFGPEESMYEADRWNPDGYFEQVDFHKINIPLINGPFGKFSYFFLPSKKTILKRADAFSKDIKKVSSAYAGKFVKENRFCLTLPAWKDNGAHVDRILICLREPYQVALSLKARNHAFIQHSLHLWYIHYRELLSNIGDIPTHVIFYENLMNPEKAAQEVFSTFNFMGLNIDKQTTAALCNKIIDAKKSDSTMTGYKYPKKVQEVWDYLRKQNKNQDL